VIKSIRYSTRECNADSLEYLKLDNSNWRTDRSPSN
jgi:hypothetical protein